MQFPTRKITTLTGHSGPVHCVTFSAGQGQYILTGSSDRTIHLYNPAKAATATTPQSSSSINSSTSSKPTYSSSNKSKPIAPGLVSTFSAHGYEVLDIAVTEDNARFASVGGDKQVFLWDVARAQTLRRWPGHGGRVNAVAFGGEAGAVVASGSFDATVRLWDTKSQSAKPIQTLTDARDSISSISLLAHELCVGSVDGRLRLYDMRMGMVYVDVLPAPITSVQQTRDGNAVLVSTLDSTIRLMDKGNGQLLQSYKGHANKDYRIRSALGMADSVVVSGNEEGGIMVWDLLEAKELLEGDAKERFGKTVHGGKVVSAVAFNGNRKEWASAGGDGQVTVWGI